MKAQTQQNLQKSYRLSASEAHNLCIGYDTPREKSASIVKGEEDRVDLSDNPLVIYGRENERNAIAEFIKVTKKVPRFILDNQDRDRFMVTDWLNLGDKSEYHIDLSATPDGVVGLDTLVEVKCPDMGLSCFDKEGLQKCGLPKDGHVPERYLWQLAMQQLVVNMQKDSKYNITKSYFLAWSPQRTRIWQYNYNLEFQKYLISLLEEFSLALVDGNTLKNPPTKERHPIIAEELKKMILRYDTQGGK